MPRIIYIHRDPQPARVRTPEELEHLKELAGPDLDGNGVRDDIDAWIAAQPLTPIQKKALTQTAADMQSTLAVDLNNPDALAAVSARNAAGIRCVYRRGVPREYLVDIEKYTANTRSRVIAYHAYNKALDGTSIAGPAGDGCAK